MTAAARLAGGALVLAVYAWTLTPSPAASPAANRSDADVEKWLALSTEAFAAGRYADALEPTSRLVTRFPTQQVYVLQLARIFGQLHRAADEAAAWERFIDVSPTPVDACPAIGNAYARAGEPLKSLGAFERCVSFDPRNSEQLFFLGLAYEHAGRTADARARYSEAAALDSSSADVRLGLARLDLRENKVVEAGRAADEVLARTPSNADALLLAGLAAERQGRPQDARKHLERALAVAADYVDVHIALGRVEAGAGRRAEARRHFERALELDPSRRAELTVWLERVADESLMRIAWSRAIAGAFWFATAAYCLLSAVPFASEQFLKPGLVPALVTFAERHASISMAALAACAVSACALAAVGPPRRARVRRLVGTGRSGGVLRAAAVAARAIDGRARARAALAGAAHLDRPDGSCPGALRDTRGHRRGRRSVP